MGQLPRRGLWAGSKATPATLTVPSPWTAMPWGCQSPLLCPQGVFFGSKPAV